MRVDEQWGSPRLPWPPTPPQPAPASGPGVAGPERDGPGGGRGAQPPPAAAPPLTAGAGAAAAPPPLRTPAPAGTRGAAAGERRGLPFSPPPRAQEGGGRQTPEGPLPWGRRQGEARRSRSETEPQVSAGGWSLAQGLPQARPRSAFSRSAGSGPGPRTPPRGSAAFPPSRRGGAAGDAGGAALDQASRVGDYSKFFMGTAPIIE